MTLSLIAPISASTLLAFAVYLIFTGRWIPRSFMKDWVTKEQFEELLADRNMWRKLALENHTDLRQVLIPTAEMAQRTFHAVDMVQQATMLESSQQRDEVHDVADKKE